MIRSIIQLACNCGIGVSALLSAMLVIPVESLAQTNPCPLLYYEEPFNTYLPAPAGCPANDAGVLPSPGTPTPSEPVSQPPLPDEEEAIATVNLVRDAVNVTLVNMTDAAIDYQVITDTDTRLLTGDSEVVLRQLPVPTTLTFNRQDGGLLQVIAVPTETNELTLRLDETVDLGQDINSVTVDADGSVFAN